MVSRDLRMVEGLQMLHAMISWIVGNNGNSIHTDPPVSAYLSNNTIYPGDQITTPNRGVQQVRYRGVLELIVAVTDYSPERNTSLNTEPSNLIVYIPLW